MTAAAGSLTRTANGGVVAADNDMNVAVDFYTPSSVRISKYPAGETFLKDGFAVIAKPEGVKLKVSEKDGSVSFISDKVNAAVDMATGCVTFRDANGHTLLAENAPAEFVPTDDGGEPSYTVSQSFGLGDSEHIYGLGNLENGQLSQRGITATLEPGNINDGIPVYISTNGYGVYWDNYAPTVFADTAEGTSFKSPASDGVDYYFMHAPSADGIIAQLRHLTGHVPMLPRWSYGFWQSRERYQNQDELLGALAEYRKRGIPIDGIIQDWQYWGDNNHWNAMEFLNEGFHHPQEMIDSVHRSNAHIIISVWAAFGPQTGQYAELREKDMLFDFGTWPPEAKAYDVYNPEAREIYWKYLRPMHLMGMDGWWMDSTEPDNSGFSEADMNRRTCLGTFRKVRGLFPLMTVEGVYDHMRAEDPDKRIFILTRSGWAGQQRTGSNVWTGDVVSSWDALRKQVPAMLNFSLTGNPNCNSDLGGFFAGAYNMEGLPAVDNPAFRELYVRWTQLGALTPMMRSHGTSVPREIYLYGEEGEPVYDALVGAVKLRYRLLPYIYSTSRRVTADDYTFMRALMMDFPADTTGHTLATEYMFGPSLLVAPVLEAQYTPEDVGKISGDIVNTDFTRTGSTKIYLPGGATWWNFSNNERHDGGAWITETTTLGDIPLYVKGGSIIPIGPEVEYADQKPWDDLEVRVYPGADGAFTLYEDEGSNNDYRKGAFTETDFRWNDAKSTLTIGKQRGKYDGMLERRQFRITLPDGRSKTVEYDGKQQKLKF